MIDSEVETALGWGHYISVNMFLLYFQQQQQMFAGWVLRRTWTLLKRQRNLFHWENLKYQQYQKLKKTDKEINVFVSIWLVLFIIKPYLTHTHTHTMCCWFHFRSLVQSVWEARMSDDSKGFRELTWIIFLDQSFPTAPGLTTGTPTQNTLLLVVWSQIIKSILDTNNTNTDL